MVEHCHAALLLLAVAFSSMHVCLNQLLASENSLCLNQPVPLPVPHCLLHLLLPASQLLLTHCNVQALPHCCYWRQSSAVCRQAGRQQQIQQALWHRQWQGLRTKLFSTHTTASDA
jgi:hypothetical protein